MLYLELYELAAIVRSNPLLNPIDSDNSRETSH